MFGRQRADEGDSGAQESGKQMDESRRSGLLRRGLFFVGAFVAGFLLGRRRSARSTAVERKHEREETQSVGGITEMGETAEEAGAKVSEEVSERVTEDAGETATEEVGEEAEEEDEGPPFTAPTTAGMPMLGLGTYQNDDYDQCVSSVTTALEMGYRHIDTAQGYDNEEAVGDAIAESDVPRDELFVATKVTPENLAYDHVVESTEESLEKLGLDRIDLLYVHWPTGEYDPVDTMDAFEELREEEKIHRIGVSNFEPDQLEDAMESSDAPIFANQIEMHPLLQQHELQQVCAEEDIEIVAYSPLARGDVGDVSEIQEVAEKHDATPEQVSLAWLREKDVTAIPKATGGKHLWQNWESLQVELDDEDVAKIDDIEQTDRQVDPDVAPWNDG